MEDFLDDMGEVETLTVSKSGTPAVDLLEEQEVIKLTEKEHILQRSGMYLGSSTLTTSANYIIAEAFKENEEGTEEISIGDRFVLTDVAYVPGLVKIFNELIDNSVDEYVRTNGKFATKIDVAVDEYTFSVKDNGRGIPVKKVKTPDGDFYQPELAWTHARAGSNFKDEDSATIGTNGVGSMIASVFSTEFIGVSQDGLNKCTVTCSDNNNSIKTKITKASAKGVHVTIRPDLSRFGIKKIDKQHIKMIEQRLYNLSVSYPGITFKLNGTRIKLNAKKFLSMFGDDGTIIEQDKFSIGVFHSDSDDFKQFSLMNGLNLTAGGTHMDYIANTITRNLRDKIIKKYKTIKPADVKRKLFIVVIMKDFKGPKYETQTKEKLTNPMKDIYAHFDGLNLDAFSDKVHKNKAITDSIIDYFRIAEEYKKQQDMKGLDKPKKKIKSEKYTKAVGKNKILIICEGASAKGGLMPILGRDGIAYYELKGKPLNCLTATHAKFMGNVELSELYQIIRQEGFEKIVIGADNDLDGIAIGGLSAVFNYKYTPEVLINNQLYILRTPIATSSKNRKVQDWVYRIDEIQHMKGDISYKKGLGSWKPADLELVIEKDGLDKMFEPLTYSEADEEAILNWYGADTTDKRKEYIMANEFDLIKL